MASVINQLSPGITVNEIDLTAIVPGVSTSTGAFVGQFIWGPVHVPVLLTNGTDLYNTFRNPNDNALNSLLGSSYFSCANFLAYSSSLYAVREVGGNSYNAIAANVWYQYVSNTKIISTSYADPILANNVLYFANNSVTANITVGMAANGSFVSMGNIIDVTYIGNTAVVTVDQNFTSNVVTNTVFSFYNLVSNNKISIKNLSDYDQNFRNMDFHNMFGPFIAKYPGKLGNSLGVSVCSGKTNFSSWTYNKSFTTAPTTSDYALTKGSNNDELHIVVFDSKGLFTGTAGTILETFPFLSKASDAVGSDGRSIYYVDYLSKYSNYIYAVDSVDYLSTEYDWGLPATENPTFVVVPNRTYTLTGGKDGDALQAGDITRGWDLFAQKELYDISLAFVGGATDLGGNAYVAQYVIDNVTSTRKDCLAFISPQYSDVVNNSGNELAAVTAFVEILNRSSSYAVVDSGWKYQYDQWNRIYRWVPLNADIAGLCAQTDYVSDSWVSPAGFTRGKLKNVVKLAWNPNQTQRDDIYSMGVNPVISYTGEGFVLFGDKTFLAKPSSFDRINVRRLFITLEKAITTASKYTLFEFNDEFTRAQFVSMVEPYLREVQGRRGISDFRVVCDESNNTPEIIDSNGFVADIYIKPARSTNFIQLNFISTPTGVDFSSIIGNY